jgi:hypothetical protein
VSRNGKNVACIWRHEKCLECRVEIALGAQRAEETPKTSHMVRVSSAKKLSVSTVPQHGHSKTCKDKSVDTASQDSDSRG